MMTLYDSRNSGNGWKVRQLLHLLGHPYERRVLDLAAGEARTPEMLALNPLGRIPVLVTDQGVKLRESNAILLVLAEGSPYLPAGAAARADMLQWLFFEQYDHLRNFARPRFLVSIARSAAPDAPEVVALREAGERALRVMDSHFARHEYVAAGQFTVADIALYPYTCMAPMGGYDLQPYPHVLAWLSRIGARPGALALP